MPGSGNFNMFIWGLLYHDFKHILPEIESSVKNTHTPLHLFSTIINLKIFIYLAAQGLSCGTQNLQSSSGHAKYLVVSDEHLVEACRILFCDQKYEHRPLH